MKEWWDFHINRVGKKARQNKQMEWPTSNQLQAIYSDFYIASHIASFSLILTGTSEEYQWNEPWLLYYEMGITQCPNWHVHCKPFFPAPVPAPTPNPVDSSAVSIISNIIPPLSHSLLLCLPRAAPIMNNLPVWRKKSVTTGVSRLITHKPVTWSRVISAIICVKRN